MAQLTVNRPGYRNKTVEILTISTDGNVQITANGLVVAQFDQDGYFRRVPSSRETRLPLRRTEGGMLARRSRND